MRLLPLIPLALTAGCGRAPAVSATDTVVVVAGGAAPKVTQADATIQRPAVEIARADPPSPQPLLSVEQSARIRTAEMWSEPIRPNE